MLLFQLYKECLRLLPIAVKEIWLKVSRLESESEAFQFLFTSNFLKIFLVLTSNHSDIKIIWNLNFSILLKLLLVHMSCDKNITDIISIHKSLICLCTVKAEPDSNCFNFYTIFSKWIQTSCFFLQSIRS